MINNFIGNQKIVNQLKKALKEKKINHAYLFFGPEKVGKFTLAEKFAKSIISESKLDISFQTSCVEDNQYIFDLIIVSPEQTEKKTIIKEKDISVEKIREARKKLALFPSFGKRKVLIIKKAELLTQGAQNILLKMLEEPNSTSVIILVSGDKERILSTVRSRCQLVHFTLVNEKDIRQSLTQKKISYFGEITAFSMGRPGIVQFFGENREEFQQCEKIIFLFQKMASLGINEKLTLAENLSKDIKKLIFILELWIWILRREYKKEKRYFKFLLIEKIENSIKIIMQSNINAKIVLENLFLSIE